jgi:hypothetical protein
MPTKFLQKVARVQQTTQSDVFLYIRPVVMKMPLPIRYYDDPFLPFGKAIIQATRDIVCGYVFDFAAYLAIGAAGAIALERTLSLLTEDNVSVLDGRFSGKSYVTLTDETAFISDALTLDDATDLNAYLQRDDRSAFIVGGDSTQAQSVPVGAGVFSGTNLFIHAGVNQINPYRIMGDEVIYADSGEDFALFIRNQIEKANNP